MPKNESDPDDPMELHGVGVLTDEDTSEAMTECFIEEFMRLGHGAEAVLSLFRNPHYTGVNMVLQNRGEPFVRAKILEVFGWWKQPVAFADPTAAPGPPHADTAQGSTEKGSPPDPNSVIASAEPGAAGNPPATFPNHHPRVQS